MLVEEFIEKVQQLDGENVLVDCDGFVTDETMPEGLVEALDNLLVTNKGTPNWAAFSHFEPFGYKYYAGEKDSFGWLTGVFETPTGKKVLI